MSHIHLLPTPLNSTADMSPSKKATPTSVYLPKSTTFNEGKISNQRVVFVKPGESVHIRRASRKNDHERMAKLTNLYFKNNHLSKEHAVITHISSGEYTIMDCGSTFGTIVNDQVLIPNTKHSLKDGDMVGFIISKPSSVIKAIIGVQDENTTSIPFSRFRNSAIALTFNLEIGSNTLLFMPVAFRTTTNYSQDSTQKQQEEVEEENRQDELPSDVIVIESDEEENDANTKNSTEVEENDNNAQDSSYVDEKTAEILKIDFNSDFESDSSAPMNIASDNDQNEKNNLGFPSLFISRSNEYENATNKEVEEEVEEAVNKDRDEEADVATRIPEDEDEDSNVVSIELHKANENKPAGDESSETNKRINRAALAPLFEAIRRASKTKESEQESEEHDHDEKEDTSYKKNMDMLAPLFEPVISIKSSQELEEESEEEEKSMEIDLDDNDEDGRLKLHAEDSQLDNDEIEEDDDIDVSPRKGLISQDSEDEQEEEIEDYDEEEEEEQGQGESEDDEEDEDEDDDIEEVEELEEDEKEYDYDEQQEEQHQRVFIFDEEQEDQERCILVDDEDEDDIEEEENLDDIPQVWLESLEDDDPDNCCICEYEIRTEFDPLKGYLRNPANVIDENDDSDVLSHKSVSSECETHTSKKRSRAEMEEEEEEEEESEVEDIVAPPVKKSKGTSVLKAVAKDIGKGLLYAGAAGVALALYGRSLSVLLFDKEIPPQGG